MKKAIIVCGLGFGDEGKGATIDYLARAGRGQDPQLPILNVRFNGGPQAGHNVVRPDGTSHTFSQFGAGTFVPGVHTHLSHHVLINPLNLKREHDHLVSLGIRDALARHTIDPRCPVISPFQVAANRLLEKLRGAGCHGSCGEGIGETMADIEAGRDDVVTALDLGSLDTLTWKFTSQQECRLEWFGNLPEEKIHNCDCLAERAMFAGGPRVVDDFAKLYHAASLGLQLANETWLQHELQGDGLFLFEGAQGVLLDQGRGFHPYTTWSTTTFENALGLLDGFTGEVVKLGLLRAIATRHGPGPFPTEDAGLAKALSDPHNTFNRWQGGLRLGLFDLVMARYAIRVAQPDMIGISHLDWLDNLHPWSVCNWYDFKESMHRWGSIPTLPSQNLALQEAMATKLFTARIGIHCFPETLTIGREYAQWLADMLGVPLGLTANGPTAYDRAAHHPALRLDSSTDRVSAF